jgi:beta-1,4-N-acetylglucosaminyltransferase
LFDVVSIILPSIRKSVAAMVSGARGVKKGSGGASSFDLGPAAVEEKKLQHDFLSGKKSGGQANTTTPPAPAPPTPPLPGRRCLVTVGATAGFRSLLEEVSTTGFFQCLAEKGFSFLAIQCGPDLALVQERVAALSDEEKHGIAVECFDFTDDMATRIISCRGERGVRRAGCVISHGGKSVSVAAMAAFCSVVTD